MLSIFTKLKPGSSLFSHNYLSQYSFNRTKFLPVLNSYSTETKSTTEIQEQNVNSQTIFSNQEQDIEKDKLYSRLEVEVKSADPAVLKSYSWFATTAAQHLGIEVGNCWAQRKANHDRLTLLKSVHIYKKHRVQYEIRTYYRYMTFHKLTGSTLDTFLEYIQRNLPEGVGMKSTKVEIQVLPEHLNKPPNKVQPQV